MMIEHPKTFNKFKSLSASKKKITSLNIDNLKDIQGKVAIHQVAPRKHQECTPKENDWGWRIQLREQT